MAPLAGADLAAGLERGDLDVVVEFRTDSREKVFPMVAAGRTNDDIQVPPFQAGAGAGTGEGGN